MNHFALESRAKVVDNEVVLFHLQTEDCTCQEAKRWPGAIHQTNTVADKQSAF